MKDRIREIVKEQRSEDPRSTIYISTKEMIESNGFTILKRISVGDYSGDDVYIMRQGNSYAVVVVGYGSCSHCDALMGICESGSADEEMIADLTNYYERIINNVKHFATKEDLLDYLTAEDAGKYSYAFNESEFKEAIPEIKNLLT